MRSIGRDPLFIARGAGSHIWDVDGNEYVDWVCSWGPLILGHANPAVIDAVTEAAARGTSFGAPTAQEVDLAAEIVERVPSVEMVRMTSSGTEATMSAIRLARAATGRERVLKFSGAYHGHVDGLLAEAGSGPGHAGRAREPRGARGAAADHDRPVESTRGAPGPARPGRDPGRAGARRTWEWCPRSPASWSCFEPRPTRAGRC